ncbi:hypothetical protein EIP91_010948 [Steccherinum ochraceum]|uniref:non-specific serine/threonine protein kinase n=1 Tax=Steccherinum ochraceum TaxID=92696 RepID=A0A4R0R023_9APHY|nr:hypothetical protein EIP91_010948 [Steccherinum ochraceum]
MSAAWATLRSARARLGLASGYRHSRPTRLPAVFRRWHNSDSVSNASKSDKVEGTRDPIEEPPGGYGMNGYCPISLQDVLNDRYKVVRKLGWGLHSTVWLAEDTRSDTHVAVKVLTGYKTNDLEFSEVAYHKCADTCNPSHPGYNHLTHLKDTFSVHSPNGPHTCLVSDVVGQTSSTLASMFYNYWMPARLVKPIIKQTLLALDYLHNECGIIHADIKPQNILLKLPKDPSFFAELLRASPTPLKRTMHLTGDTHIPVVTCLQSQPFFLSMDEVINLEEVDVVLTDLGVAFWKSKTRELVGGCFQSPSFRAPEVILGASFSTSIDIWSVGCLAFEYLFGRPLFRPKESEHHLFLLACELGDFPPKELRSRGMHMHHAFDEDGNFFTDVPPREERRDLHFWVSMLADMDAEEQSKLLSFWQQTFAYMPEDRPTAGQLAKHPWFND